MEQRAHADEQAPGTFGRWPKGVEWWLGIFLALFAATSLCFPSSELFARRQHRDEAVQHQLAIATHVPMQIDGQPNDISEYRSRVLVPFVLLTLKRLNVLKTDADRFMALRLVSATVFFLVAYVFVFDRRSTLRLSPASGFVHTNGTSSRTSAGQYRPRHWRQSVARSCTMRLMTLALVVVLVVSVGAATVTRTHRVSLKVTGAQLLWSPDDAYLFVGTKQVGWQFSYLRLFGEVVLQLVGIITPPQDAKPTTMMFRITTNGVERHVLDNIELATQYTVFESRVRIGPRWLWTGSQFERTTPDEERRLARAMPRPPSVFPARSGDYVNVDGWSSRHFLPMRVPADGWKLPFSTAGQDATLMVVSDTPESIDIDLQRGNHQRERLLSLDERLQSVSQAEYRTLLSSPSMAVQP